MYDRVLPKSFTCFIWGRGENYLLYQHEFSNSYNILQLELISGISSSLLHVVIVLRIIVSSKNSTLPPRALTLSSRAFVNTEDINPFSNMNVEVVNTGTKR